MSHTISLEINNRTLSIELGKMGKQADGSAFVRYGETVVFVAATSKKEAREDKPFLPLVVDYRENTYAAGKIPGGFFKREGRPTEREILTSRLIDRPVRSLFPEGYYNETQIVAMLLSADLENEPETLALIGASAALYFSDIPYATPMGAVKVGILDGKYVINPNGKEWEASPLNLLVVGTEEGVVMIEAGAKEVDEETVLGAIEAALHPIRQIIDAQKDLYRTLAIQKRAFTAKPTNEAKFAEIEQKIGAALHQAIQTPGKKAHEAAVGAVDKDLIAIGWTDAVLTISVRSPSKSDSYLEPTVRPCSLGAKPKPWPRSPWARSRMPNASTAWARKCRSGSCSTIISRLFRSGKSDSCAAPAGGRSDTAPWPRKPSFRRSRARNSSLTPSASFRISSNRTARRPWPRFAAASSP
jgi:ribonuclease PH